MNETCDGSGKADCNALPLRRSTDLGKWSERWQSRQDTKALTRSHEITKILLGSGESRRPSWEARSVCIGIFILREAYERTPHELYSTIVNKYHLTNSTSRHYQVLYVSTKATE